MPQVSVFVQILWMAGIAYCIVKYRFFPVTPEYMSKEIISSIDESIILFDTDNNILYANKQATGILKTAMDGKDILPGLTSDNIAVENALAALHEGLTESVSSRFHYFRDDVKVYIDFKFSAVKDRFNDIAGFLAIGREVKEFHHFKIRYNISDRQLEIVRLAIDGLSNDEICEKLGLARRTVETHLFNIYNKLSINNKIELMKLANTYNLVQKN
jgi:DNA-binding CsgD family transcriptional regulator